MRSLSNAGLILRGLPVSLSLASARRQEHGPSADALVAFYDGVTTRFRTHDPNHLICAGGFNHMEDHPELNWWQRIYSLTNNDIGGYKTYSQHDLDYVATVTSYTNSINKPAFEAEFGIPQYMGDCTWSGHTYNGINTSRSDFFTNVYDRGLAGGTAVFVFWNLGNQAGDTSYNVSPTVSPCTWASNNTLRLRLRDFSPLIYAHF